MSAIRRITCPSCGSSRFKHDAEDNLICDYCDTKFASPRELVLCATCGTDNPPGARVCMECGRRLEVTCPNCGHVNPPGRDHCSECATPIDVMANVIKRATNQDDLKRKLVHTKYADEEFLDAEIERRDAEQQAKIAALKSTRNKQNQRIRLYFAIGIGVLVLLFVAMLIVVLSVSPLQ